MPGGSGHRGTSCRGMGPWRMQDTMTKDRGTLPGGRSDQEREDRGITQGDRGTVEQFKNAVGTVEELPWEQTSGRRLESGLELENW